MIHPRVEVEATYYVLYYGFESLGVFSAYQLIQIPEWELDLYWGYLIQ